MQALGLGRCLRLRYPPPFILFGTLPCFRYVLTSGLCFLFLAALLRRQPRLTQRLRDVVAEVLNLLGLL